jgi:hypothetical protein
MDAVGSRKPPRLETHPETTEEDPMGIWEAHEREETQC